MSAVEPDAWDECATCGHDREDHHRSGCLVTETSRFGPTCGCVGFAEESA